MTKFTVPYVKGESLANIKITGAFYARLQDLLIDYTKDKFHGPKADPKILGEKIKEILITDSPKTPEETHLQTLLQLVNYIEEEFSKQGLLETAEMEINEEGVMNRLS